MIINCLNKKRYEKHFIKLSKATVAACCRAMGYKTEPRLKKVRFDHGEYSIAFIEIRGKYYIHYDIDVFNNIYLNNTQEEKDDILIFTMAHECRHFYQYKQLAAENPDEKEETLKKWDYEFENYADVTGGASLSEFNKQAVEIDANLFGLLALAEMSDSLLLLDHISDDYIELLEQRHIEIYGCTDDVIFDRELYTRERAIHNKKIAERNNKS